MPWQAKDTQMMMAAFRRSVMATVGGLTLSAASVTGVLAGSSKPPPHTARCSLQPSFLVSQINSGETEENFVTQVMEPLRSADRNGDGLDESDITFVQQRAQAQLRAQKVQSVLAYDLDGDLKVTHSELEAMAPPSGKLTVRSFDSSEAGRLLAEYDANHDGVITLQEVVSQTDTQQSPEDYGVRRLRQLLQLAHDSRLSASELHRVAQGVFESVDRDHDGVISQEEYEAIR